MSRKSPEYLQRHKDTLISSHTHTHTHTHIHTHARTHARTPPSYTHAHAPRLSHTHTYYITGDGLWYIGKKENDRSVCRREEVGFQFWLKRTEWRRMPDRERKRVPDHRSDVLKESLPIGPPVHPRNTEYSSIRGWARRARRRVQMQQLGEVWRCCTRDKVEADESYFVLNPAADW